MIYIDAATLSLNGGVKPVEVYVPLWFASGQYNGTSLGGTSAGNSFLQDGNGQSSNNTVVSQMKLFTLNSSCPASTKFAYESTTYVNGAGTTGYKALWDFTANAVVSGSTITTTATTAAVVRSGQFTLTSGHVYGITTWNSSANYYPTNIDDSLIIIP